MDKRTIIDVSEFQGDIDWAKVKNAVGGAIIRAAIRGSLKETAPDYYMKMREDFSFRDNIGGVERYGIPYTLYFFPTACTTAEAVEEATYFYNLAKLCPVVPSFPYALDSENVWGKDHEAGRANGLSREERTRLLKIILDYFNSHGLQCGIYASASWLNNKIDMDKLTDEQRACTWVADSTGEVDYKGEYWLHQYGKETCPGIKKKVDCNRIHGDVPVLGDGKVANPSFGQAQDIVVDPVDAVLAIAESEVGYHEKKSAAELYTKKGNAGGNNYTKYGKELHEIQPRNMDYPAAWCDCFVDWCFVKAFGATTAKKVLCGDFDDYTYSSVNLYKKAGRWTKNAARGYQIFFGGSGHTGIVYKVEKCIVYTIEGNKSDEVRKCKYSLTDPKIIGYGMPLYSIVAPQVVRLDDLHTVKWSGYTKRESKVYTQPDADSAQCSFSPVGQGEEVGVCKRVGQFYFCKFTKVGKYGYIHRTHIRK